MIKDNQQYFNRLHVIMDALVIAGSYILAWYLWIGRNRNDGGAPVGVLDMGIYFSALYFVVPGYLILYYWFKLYSPKRVQRNETEILNAINKVLADLGSEGIQELVNKHLGITE